MSHIRIYKHYFKAHFLALGLVEFLLLIVAVYIAILMRFWSASDEVISDYLDYLWPRAILFATVMTVSMVSMGVYQSRIHEGLTGMTLRTIVSFFLLGAAALSVLFYLIPSVELILGRGVLALSSINALILVTVFRFISYKLVSEDNLKLRVLVLGTGKQAASLQEMTERAELGNNYHIVGFVHIEGAQDVIATENVIHLNSSLLQFAASNKVDEIIVAMDERRQTNNSGSGIPLRDLLDCKLSGYSIIEKINFLEREGGKIDVRLLKPSWLVFSDGFTRSTASEYVFRFFDILCSLLLLLVSFPIMLLTALAVKLEDGLRAPIIYHQQRVGLNGKTFNVHKFRSMSVDAEKDGKAIWAQESDCRVTKVGNFIRNVRIDELPQIFNVLVGEMSFVGPRPERPEFVSKLRENIPYFDERHRVKPGITGWAQLCYSYGASEEDSEEKLKYDLYYVKNKSLLLDLLILIQTVEVVLIGRGVR